MFIILLFIFVMGLVWGSFLNVVIYRSAKGKSFAQGRSICPKCKTQLPWRYNIPLLSFFLLGGRCGFCHKKISWRYPFIEFSTAVMFMWWYLVGMGFFQLIGSPWQVIQPIFWLVVGMVLLVIFMSDLFYGIIPLGVNMFLFSVVLFYRVTLVGFGLMNGRDLFNALLSAVVLGIIFISLQRLTKIFKGVDGIGWGDIILSPALGLLLGWPKVMVGMFAAVTLGGLLSVILLLSGKKSLGQTIPFGPFLVVGTVIGLIWGASIWSWYMGMLQ